MGGSMNADGRLAGDPERIRAALSCIPADNRDTWLRMGMAVKSELGDAGFDVWDGWSQQADSYNAHDARSTWKSIGGNGKVTAGTLFHEAKANGWRDDGTQRTPTPDEIAERRRAAAQRAATDEAARARERADAATKAAEIWKAATPAADDHPYLQRKGVRAHGICQSGDKLVIPLRDGGELHSLQFIGDDGAKRYLPGGRVSGCYFSIGRPDGRICVAEGYATGATIHEATGCAVAVAFACGNLRVVAEAIKAKYPAATLILCADDDYRTDGNPGLTTATEAARAVGGLLAVPDFGADRPEGATDFNDLAQHRGGEAVVGAIARAAAPDVSAQQPAATSAPAADSGDWPRPEPLTVAEDETPYPLAALPSGIREAVGEVVAFVQCPAALAACSALSALSLSGQSLANVRRADRLEGPVSLYLLAVADSGERKSSCDGYFLQPIREWEREQAERSKPELAEHAAKLGAWEERRAGIKTRIRDAARKGEDTGDAERELAGVEAEQPGALRVPSLLHADCTPEALAWALAHGWPSGGVMSSEAGIVFGGHGMGRDSVMRNLSLMNAFWDGAQHRVERRTSDSFTVANARLTMGLATQPETVRQFMEATKGLARGNGFAARFLIAAPASTQGTRPFRAAGEWRHLPAFAAQLRELLALPVQLDDAGGLILPTLPLTAEARALWVRFHDDIEAELRPGGDMAEVRDVASKAADNAARLAALFHLYAYGPGGEVGAESVNAAATVVGWHLYQARAFLGDVAGPREMSYARRLDAWLVDYCNRIGVRAVGRRTIQQCGPNPVRGRPTLDAVLAELAEAGRIREADKGRQRLIEVNPALLGGGDGAA